MGHSYFGGLKQATQMQYAEHLSLSLSLALDFWSLLNGAHRKGFPGSKPDDGMPSPVQN